MWWSVYRKQLDLETLVSTRGPNFPLSRLKSRLMCPACGSRRVTVRTPTNSQVRGGDCHANLASAEGKSERLGLNSSRGRCPPVPEGFASEGAERVAGNKIALDVEGVLDGGGNGQKPLR
jgi:hypothetical protein